MCTASEHRRVSTIFLDRDGVLNRKAPEGEYVWLPGQVEWLPGALEALRLLHDADLPAYIVSNQRGVALGLYSESDVEQLHRWMHGVFEREAGGVQGFYYCPHDRQQCTCRKPLPGLFEQARREHPEIEWITSAMIGDSLSDIEAGRRLKMCTIFIEGEAERRKPGAEKAAQLADATCASLLEAVRMLLKNQLG